MDPVNNAIGQYLADALSVVDRVLPPASNEVAINIVFDGPPSHESGRFVEVENDAGQSIKCGEWIERDDGLWALRIVSPNSEEKRLRKALRAILVSDDLVAAKEVARTEIERHAESA